MDSPLQININSLFLSTEVQLTLSNNINPSSPRIPVVQTNQDNSFIDNNIIPCNNHDQNESQNYPLNYNNNLEPEEPSNYNNKLPTHEIVDLNLISSNQSLNSNNNMEGHSQNQIIQQASNQNLEHNNEPDDFTFQNDDYSRNISHSCFSPRRLRPRRK